MRATFSNHFTIMTLAAFGAGYEQWRHSTLYNNLNPPSDFSPLCQTYLLTTALSTTLNVLSSLRVEDQVSHPYKTTDMVKFRIFQFLGLQKRDGKQNILNWMAASIPKLNLLLTSTLTNFWLIAVISLVFKLCQIFAGLITYFCTIILSCILVTRH